MSKLVQDDFITYWPVSGNFYVGDRTHHDPGSSSPHLLASMKKVDSAYQAELKSKELIQCAKNIKSATAVANDANLEHLQVIRLAERIMGEPDQEFFLENVADKIDVDMLELRQTVRSNSDSVQRKNRLEETKVKKTTYAEYKFEISKLSGKTWTPIEDKMRTIRDPEAIDLQNLTWEFQYARNAELKAVIEDGVIRGAGGTTTVTDLGNIATPAANFHSTKNIANAISAAIKTFRTRNRSKIHYAIFDVEGWDKYVSNTWTGPKAGPLEISIPRYPNGGIVDMPGFPGIKAIIEPELGNDSKIYFLHREAIKAGQGPQLYRRFYDEEKDAEAVKILDFVQFLSVDKEIDHSKIGDRYFSFVASFSG